MKTTTLDVLASYLAEGKLIKQTHPTLPLTIWNYSKTAAYAGEWDIVTRACRGLVTDNLTGEVVARPFQKFFNMEEGKHTATPTFKVFEKLDGSLGILFNYKGEWIFASRGSFTSDQALKGAELLKMYDIDSYCIPGYTYLFEIIYPSNRIVVDYGDDEKLVLLGVIETVTGEEINYSTRTSIFETAKEYDGVSDFSTLKGIIKNNQEGFIIKFSNGDRMKIKGEEYIRLHSILTNTSSKVIWRALKDRSSLEEILDNVPDEFNLWVQRCINDLKESYLYIEDIAFKRFVEWKYATKGTTPSRKDFAEYANKQDSLTRGILFSLYDGRDYSDAIWRAIEPSYEKPFYIEES